MKIGVETITWGIRLDDIEGVLDFIADLGYEGVEIAQRFDAIGIRDIDHLLALLDKRRLCLIGLVGGTLSERIEFCRTPCLEYLYVEPWELPNIDAALDRGFIPALHPRIFTAISRLEDTLRVLGHHPRLRVIVDTAHAAIAGHQPRDVIEAVYDRLAAVHLKDWTPTFGRSSHRYARGFTELGLGAVDLTSAISTLKRLNYSGWLITELDQPRQHPRHSVLNCSRWLVTNGVLRRPISEDMRSHLPPSPDATTTRPEHISPTRISPVREAHFRKTLMTAIMQGSETFYQTLAVALNEVVPAHYVRVWTYSQMQNYMALLASVIGGVVELGDEHQLTPTELLTGVAMHRHAPVTRFDLSDPHPAARYGYPHLRYKFVEHRDNLGVRHVVSLPIYNSGNQNYVRLLINIAPITLSDCPTDDEFYAMGQAITQAADFMLDQLSMAATGRVNLLAGRATAIATFAADLALLIRDELDCEGLTIFGCNDAGDRLEVVGTTGIVWHVPENEEYYLKDQGLTGRVWARGEPLLTVNAQDHPNRMRKSDEHVTRSDHFGTLIVPLIDASGTVIGVVRCRNKNSKIREGGRHMFSEDDAAVLDAICQAAVPHFQRLRSEEQRRKTVERLTHELSVPVVAIRGAAQRMRSELQRRTIFREAYPDDIWSWSELMRGLLGKSDIFRYGTGTIPLTISGPVKLMAAVVAPAVRQVEMYLRERGFSRDRIEYRDFMSVPGLWVDRSHFQQIIFNLLSNAIKYAYNDPDAFRVEITGQSAGAHYEVCVRDWGIGIEDQYTKAVFQEGFRSPQAKKRDIRGDGLGLWIVSRLVQAHEGTVRVARARLPTEITLTLPRWLAERPPGTRSR